MYIFSDEEDLLLSGHDATDRMGELRKEQCVYIFPGLKDFAPFSKEKKEKLRLLSFKIEFIHWAIPNLFRGLWNRMYFFFSYWQWHYNICWSRRGGTERVNFCWVFITYFVFARKFSKVKVLFLFFYQKQRLIQILTLLIEMERVGSHSLGKGSKCIKMLCLYMEVSRAKFLWGEGIECLRGKMDRSPHLSGEKFFFKANDFA